MNEQKMADYCLSKPGAEQDYPYGPDLTVFKVGGKVFATIYRKDGIIRYGMKCEPVLAELLRGQYSSVAPMYKSPNWIYIYCGGDVPDDAIALQIDHSYDLIVKSLTRKVREQIAAGIVKKPEMTSTEAVAIIKLLEQNGIEVYVDGGWGVDALLGEQTRKHDDLDVAVPHEYVPKLRELLEIRGYKDVPRDDTRECNFVLGDDKGHLVDVHSYTFDENGNNIFGVAYVPRHLSGAGAIDGYPVKCPPPDVMVEFHTGYDVDENDYRDAKALCERFNIPLPKGFDKFE